MNKIMESKRCCFILSLFGQGLGYLIFKYKTKTLASLCIQLLVALSKILSLSVFQESEGSGSSCKAAWGLGGDGVVEPV